MLKSGGHFPKTKQNKTDRLKTTEKMNIIPNK